jgi:hypothetical protein
MAVKIASVRSNRKFSDMCLPIWALLVGFVQTQLNLRN